MKSYFKYFFVILFVGVGYLSFLVIQPLIAAIVMGAVIAYVFYPFYQWSQKYVKNKQVCAFGVSILIILLFSIPTLILINNTAEEARFFYVKAKQTLLSGNILAGGCPGDSSLCSIVDKFKEWVQNPSIKKFLEDGISKFSTFILEEASRIIFSLPKIILNLFVSFFVSFYLMIDGKAWVHRIKELLPIKEKFQKEVFTKIDKITYAVVYGSLIVALIQGAVGAIGFFLFGINAPILWGILMTIFALIPLLGTAIIWLPISLIMILDGYLANENMMVLKGLGLLVYGAVLIAGIDNVIKPKLISKKAEVHPVVILLGVLGGLSFLGFFGFIVGPLILALFLALLDIYSKEKAVLLK